MKDNTNLQSNNNLITMNSPQVDAFFRLLDKVSNDIEMVLKDCTPTLNTERYLTDKDVSEKLKVTRRTLHDWRNEGKISYYHLGGKILYRESDIMKKLSENYRKAYR